MTRAHDRNARLGDGFYISTHVKNQRRIVNLFELCRIGGFIDADDGDARRGGASQFVLRQFDRASGGQRLRRDRSNPGRFQFGQRSSKDVLHAAQMLDQASPTPWTQAFG